MSKPQKIGRPESDSLETEVERVIPTPGDEETEREAQAEDEPELVQKEYQSRAGLIMLIGCAITIPIVLCLVGVGVFRLFKAAEDSLAPFIGNEVAATSEPEPTAEVNETDLLTATPQEVVVATRTLEPAPTQSDPSPGPVDSAAGEILFSDTFDGAAASENWDLWQDEDAEFSIDNGTLIATGFDEDTLNWAKQLDSYTDLEVNVTADILAGGRSAFFGVVFDGDGDNYVGCFVQGDNTAYCAESLDGETEFGDWVNADLSILSDNEILFVVSDGEWAMAVNDNCVGSGFVDFGPEGQPALAVSTTNNEDTASIAYDDFMVRIPTEEGLALLHCEPELFE